MGLIAAMSRATDPRCLSVGSLIELETPLQESLVLVVRVRFPLRRPEGRLHRSRCQIRRLPKEISTPTPSNTMDIAPMRHGLQERERPEMR